MQQEQYPEQYIEHNGELYKYWNGQFYKRRASGTLENVFDRLLIIDLVGKLKTPEQDPVHPGTLRGAFYPLHHEVKKLTVTADELLNVTTPLRKAQEKLKNIFTNE